MIGRTGAVPSTDLAKRSFGLDATSRLDEASDGALEGDEEVSCVIANVCTDEETRVGGEGRRGDPLSFYSLSAPRSLRGDERV